MPLWCAARPEKYKVRSLQFPLSRLYLPPLLSPLGAEGRGEARPKGWRLSCTSGCLEIIFSEKALNIPFDPADKLLNMELQPQAILCLA